MKPGYKAIYERYRQNIQAGILKPGDKVPAIRVLALELGVARKTVEAAYAILTGEGYLVSQGAQGTRVNPDLLIKHRPADPIEPGDATLGALVDIRDKSGELRLGIPSLDAFPYKKWLLLAGKSVRSMRPSDMVNPPVMGYAPLREAIASYVNISRGLNCTAEQIFITSGYRNTLTLILETLAARTDKVVFEDPGYYFGKTLLRRSVDHLHYIPVDERGMDVDYFLRYHRDARFVIVTPSHHSPLAVTLSLPRKHQLLEWARETDGWIIEDDYDGEFHYTRKVLPALKSLDAHDRVIYTGTFSKTIMPALRISYIVMPKSTLSAFKETGEITENGQPVMTQKILTAFLAEGHFYRHLKKMRALYQARRQMMLDALSQVYPHDFHSEMHDGGMHIVAFLNKGTQDRELAEIWQRHHLRVSPLSDWYSLSPKRYGLIIGYTNIRSTEDAVALLQRPQQETQTLLA
ncbi:PLP-dependent aminotransferase family protein [Enterobacter sp.]|uniref:MocR-like pyridoxine biosynthesis transcription factor PdxR n=1 Tax=Enterobacter sp. TaxID=42895 RepID=UPI00296FD0A0|nr:PLP-dependent aminotransferase family protein [Enterobacter sp.]